MNFLGRDLQRAWIRGFAGLGSLDSTVGKLYISLCGLLNGKLFFNSAYSNSPPNTACFQRSKMAPVVLMGPSGCGKSTIAALLQREIGCPFIEGDDLHSQQNILKMSSGVPLNDDDRQPWLERIYTIILESRTTNTSNKSISIIVTCSALKRSYREILSRPPNSDLLFVFLNAPRNVLENRVQHRKGHFLPTSLIPSQLEALEIPREGDENCLPVDATLKPEDIVAQILAHLSST